MERYSMDEVDGGIDMAVDISVSNEKIGLGFGAIHAEDMSDEEARIFAEKVASFRRVIDLSAPAVCIDGRRLADGELPFPLGPHIAGGAMSLLVGARASHHPYQGVEMLKYAQSRGFELRAHGDTTNKQADYKNGTGCGANDRLPEISDKYAGNKYEIAKVAKSLLGDSYNDSIMMGIQLQDPTSSGWTKTFLKDMLGEDKVENLHDDHEGVHGHKEQMVVFNYVPNTTIDRDALVDETGTQVFVVDVWYLQELAKRLATGPKAAEQASQMLHAMVAYQVATYITLCDGSHRTMVLS